MAARVNNIKKQAMIKALEQRLGVVTDACKSVGINRATHYKWLNSDKDYKQQVEAIENVAIDFVESKLYEKIQKGDTACIIFYMKTKGKNRGYVERIDHDITSKGEQVKLPDINIGTKK